MSEDKDPEIEEQIEIPVEEDIDQLKADEKASDGPDLVAEFQTLGRTFAESFEAAWNSEERKRVEAEVRTGVQTFADEVDKVIREAKKSRAGELMTKEAEEMAKQVESSEIGRRALEGIAQGLSWMSLEMGKLAEQFKPEEKAAEEPEEKAPEE
jgi:hypothetical protein